VNRKVILLQFRSQALENEQRTASVSIEIVGREQKIITNFVQYLRDNGTGNVGPVGPTYVGTVVARDATQIKCTNLEGISISARTSAQGAGGNYGVFLPWHTRGRNVSLFQRLVIWSTTEH